MAERLADRLRSHLGIDGPGSLRDTQFVAVPRGGLIVLGILSYLLGLRSNQIRTTETAGSERVVIIDDCAQSGARLAATVARLRADRLIGGVLLAPTPLCRAAEAAEKRLETVLVGEELEVCPPESSPSEPLSALANSLQGRRYWLGRTEPIAFPWSEPEQVFASRFGSGVDAGWRRLSPTATLRGRGEAQIGRLREHGLYEHPEGVFWRWDGDGVLFWRAATDRVTRLDATGRSMWRALLSASAHEDAVNRLSSEFAVDSETLRNDLDQLAQRLVEAGLLRLTT